MKMVMLYEVQLEGKEGQSAGTTHTMELFENFKKIGTEVHLFVPKSKDATPYKQPGIIYLPILNIPLLCGVSYQLVLLFYYLLYQIKRTKPDIIYSRFSSLTISPVILSKILRIPYIVEMNGGGIEELKLSGGSRLMIQIFNVIERLNYKHAKKIVAVTKGIKERIRESYDLPDEKIVVIENGSNIKLFRPRDLTKAKKELKFNRNANYVCFVGNFAPWQGIEFLIQSAPLILKEISNTRFLIVGYGVMKEMLTKMVKQLELGDNFIFTGVVPYEDVPKYINASDVCVVPKRSLNSGYSPLKLYEYMACGKPVVASKVEGFEILEQQNAGILVEPEDPEELAKVILKLLKDEKLREEMGRNGRDYVVKNRSWKSVARRVAKVCESAAGEHKNKMS